MENIFEEIFVTKGHMSKTGVAVKEECVISLKKRCVLVLSK